MFDSREIAYLIWGTIVFIVILFFKKVRPSVVNLIKAFFCKKFIYVYLIALSYIFICIWSLYKIKIWDISLTKDTVIWIVFIALPLMYKAARVESFQNFVKSIIHPIVAFSIIFEFLFSLYTFKWWLEIIMVPLSFFIVGMTVYSENKPEYKQINKLINGIFNLIWLFSVFAVVIHLFHNYADYLNRTTLMQFILPLFLSLLFLPFLFGLAMFIHYESAFVALKRHFKESRVYYYSIFQLILRFHGDLEGLKRWKIMVFSKNLQTRDEIDHAITLVKTLQAAEKNPHSVNEGLGWSPYQVKDLLNNMGIKTQEYQNTFDDEFSSISYPFNLTNDLLFSDTLTYMVNGKQAIATELTIGLKVFNGTIENTESRVSLLECSKTLYHSVFGEELPDQIKTAIINAKEDCLDNLFSKLSVKKELWANKTKGYSLDFIITHRKHQKNRLY